VFDGSEEMASKIKELLNTGTAVQNIILVCGFVIAIGRICMVEAKSGADRPAKKAPTG
jgi:hypothetical protein